MGAADLYRETARIFGIQRLGQKVEDRVRAAAGTLAAEGAREEEGWADRVEGLAAQRLN